jgi:hypothetical protein
MRIFVNDYLKASDLELLDCSLQNVWSSKNFIQF